MSALPPLWDRLQYRLKNSRLGVLVLASVAVLAFGRSALDFVDRFRSSDLVVSSLATSRLVTALDGYPVITPPSGSSDRVYAAGARITLVLEHNRRSTSPVTVTGLRLKLREYSSGVRPEYAYEANADSIIGAGTRKPYIYHVRLLGRTVERANWLANFDSSVVTARSANFFDTARPFALTLEPKEPAELIEVTVVAVTPGLYALSFILDYAVDGEEREAAPKGELMIYRQE